MKLDQHKKPLLSGTTGKRAYAIQDSGFEYLAGVGEKDEQGIHGVSMPFNSIAGAVLFISRMMKEKKLQENKT